jgi:RNA polymerase sigma factor (sigma-70 family)
MNGPMTDTQSERRARFDELFSLYSRDIAAYCSWRRAAGTDPQDAVAEVFLAAWRRLDDLPPGDGARVWLYATARRVLANQRRSQRRRLALQDRLAQQAAFPPVGEGDEHARVHAALRRLSRADREVLLLADWEGLTASQIASVVGCLAVTARGRLHRARRRFRAAFDEMEQRDQASISSMQRLRRIDEHI